MYEIHYESRKVTIWGDIPEEYKYDITFEDFQKRFLYTVRIWNQLFKQFDLYREIAAKNNMQTSSILLSEGGGNLFIHAEMIKRGDDLETGFKGYVTKS